LNAQWRLAPTADPAFVWQREDVVSVSERPLDAARPVVWLDETSRHLLGEVRPPLPPAPGRTARHDPEYVRGGVANLFVVTEPLRGWRHVRVRQQRTRRDWAACIKELVDIHDPAADQIVFVMDQLNTHSPASLDAAFPPTEAQRLANKLEIHHTPKHGSWLNMAERELAVLHRRCLVRQLPDRTAMAHAVPAWAARRHGAGAAIDWRFTTADARSQLRRLYPAFQD
jgi:DDE superfamily endonuclease